MKYKLNNSNGFSVVEAALVVVVVGVLGAAGYHVYSSQKQTKNMAVSTSATPPASGQKNGIYAGWQTYTGSDFTAKYPKGWHAVDADLGSADPNLKTTYFSTEALKKDQDPSRTKSHIEVSVFHKGYYIADDNGKRLLVDDTVDAATFARDMNGLYSDDTFLQVHKETLNIGGVEAIKFKGGAFDTP